MDELISKTVPESIRLNRPLKLDTPLCKKLCVFYCEAKVFVYLFIEEGATQAGSLTCAGVHCRKSLLCVGGMWCWKC